MCTRCKICGSFRKSVINEDHNFWSDWKCKTPNSVSSNYSTSKPPLETKEIICCKCSKVLSIIYCPLCNKATRRKEKCSFCSAALAGVKKCFSCHDEDNEKLALNTKVRRYSITIIHN